MAQVSHLIQLLLPRTSGLAPGKLEGCFAETRAELVAAFKGVTAYLRSPAQGLWTAPDGQVEQDEMIMVEVVADEFDVEWWRDYADKLARRFDQEEIHVRALRVDTL